MKVLKHFENMRQDIFNKNNAKGIKIDEENMQRFLEKSSTFSNNNNIKIGDEKSFTKNNIYFTQYLTSNGLFEKSTFTKNNYTNITYEGYIKNSKSFKQRAYVNITIHERVYSQAIKIKEAIAIIKYDNKDFEHLKHFSHIMKAEDNDNKIYEMIDEIEEYLLEQKQIRNQNILKTFKYNDNKQVNKEIENIENALYN